jgi:hypothetical protein
MKIKAEQEEMIINFGVFGYSAEKMASVLGVDLLEIEKCLQDKDSQFSKLIQKGSDLADYVIDLKLFEMAKSGDIKALDKLEVRKKFRNLKTNK